MPSIQPENLKKIIEKRIEQPNNMFVKIPLPGRLELMLQIRWWPQYRTYQAIPIMQSADRWFSVKITMDDPWFRYLKRKLRREFGLRHVGNINHKDNAKRIESLIGLQHR